MADYYYRRTEKNLNSRRGCCPPEIIDVQYTIPNRVLTVEVERGPGWLASHPSHYVHDSLAGNVYFLF